MRRQIGVNRRNLGVLAVVAALLLVAHLLVPHWSTRYASYLVVFSIWMVWFVQVVVDWLAEVDAEQ